MHHTCKKEAQQKIGRHLIDKFDYLLHHSKLFLGLTFRVQRYGIFFASQRHFDYYSLVSSSAALSYVVW